MRLHIKSFATMAALASVLVINAHEAGHSGSKEFQKMKTLVGKWQGKADMGEGPVDMTVQYRLLAGGSVLEERVFEGTPNEMVTMYYEQHGKLALTHYCVMGNRPGMLLQSSSDNTLAFAFDPNCGIDAAKESHMNALTISFDSPDKITSTCKAVIDGKPKDGHPTTLTRID